MTDRHDWLAVATMLAIWAFATWLVANLNGEEATAVSLPLAEWQCTDMEPDGCAEYRRDVQRQMHESARR